MSWRFVPIVGCAALLAERFCSHARAAAIAVFSISSYRRKSGVDSPAQYSFCCLHGLTLHAFCIRNTWKIQSVFYEAKLPKPGYGEAGNRHRPHCRCRPPSPAPDCMLFTSGILGKYTAPKPKLSYPSQATPKAGNRYRPPPPL